MERGACLVKLGTEVGPACRLTYRLKEGVPYRLIYSYALKAPECYLSVYQSGCNFYCLKCHSWRFTRYAKGTWMSPNDVARLAEGYLVKYGSKIYEEPRGRATAYHASSLCLACGYCFVRGMRSALCPGVLPRDKVVEMDDGNFGPARNIISFTGGDLACNPEFYVESTREVKSRTKGRLWVIFETNGYGLSDDVLDAMKEAGLDGFWLDIKAYYDNVHRVLTGCGNKRILELPEKIVERDFVLEVSTVLIPGLVDVDQIAKIAELLAQVDKWIPYSIIAFIPEFELINFRPPKFNEMLNAFYAAKDAGLKNVRLANLGVFVESEEQLQALKELKAI